MPVDWMQQFQNTVAQGDARKKSLSDEERTRQKGMFEAASHNIQKHVALLLNPDTMQPMPGKEAQVAQLRGEMNRINEHLTKFSDPNFNPQTGMVNEDPIHKLTDKLHLTKPPAQNVTAAQQMQDLKGIQQKYAEEPPLLNPEEQRKEARIKGKLEPGASGTGRPVLKPYKLADGTTAYLDASDRDNLPEGAEPILPGHASIKERIVPDPTSSTGFASEGYDSEGKQVYRVQNVVPPRSAMARETDTTDPFGVTTKSVSKPLYSGAKGGEKPTGTSKQSKPPGEQVQDLKGIREKSKIGQPGKVDEKGHIPESAKVNPQLREAANNLLDGMAVKDLQVPQKDKAAAQELARQYGWKGQGMFTPKDMLLVRESTAILSQLAKDPSLTVLDNQMSRQKIQQVLQNAEKRNMFGQALQSWVASQLTEPEQKFVTLYMQAVGRISGLSQLVRSGRATEAQIERLKAELPNPATTTNSAHALQKLQQIQSEIDIALDKGQFLEVPAAGDVSDDEFLQKVSH